MEPAQIDGPPKTQRRLVALRRRGWERMLSGRSRLQNCTHTLWETQAHMDQKLMGGCWKDNRNWGVCWNWEVFSHHFVMLLNLLQNRQKGGQREGAGRPREAGTLQDHVSVTPFGNLTKQDEAVPRPGLNLRTSTRAAGRHRYYPHGHPARMKLQT